jgi:hypothetical protein
MNGLSVEQVEQFHTEGFLLVEDLFDPEADLAPILAEYECVLDTLAGDLYEQGLIASRYEELPFSDRLIRIYEESGTVHPQARCTRSISIFRCRRTA